MRRISFLLLILPLLIFARPAGAQTSGAAIDNFQEMLGVRGVWAAQVSAIAPESVAETLDLELDDLVTGFNGKSIRDFADFYVFLSRMRQAALEGEAVLDILRYDSVSETYSQHTSAAMVSGGLAPEQQLIGFQSGLKFLVQEVLPDSPAQRMELEPGDFVEKINDKVVTNLAGPSDVDAILQNVLSTSSREIRIFATRWQRVDETNIEGIHSREAKTNL